jgi:hypothetical protein
VIRIVGLQRSSSPQSEFILLQNQGALRLNLRGHMVMSESALSSDDLGDAVHLFRDDVVMGPGHYVLLITGCGQARWTKTKEQQLVYHTYMDREASVWTHEAGPMHILSAHHSYVDRREIVSV